MEICIMVICDNGYLWQRVNYQLASPSQPYSLREALAQAQSSRIGASAQALRESLHPILRQKLVQTARLKALLTITLSELILVLALDASLWHALLGSDRYAAAESFYKLGITFAPVPDLHIMWLLHLCDAHQEMQSWAEAAQCVVAVAGVIMQALVARNDGVWSKDHVSALRKICPMLANKLFSQAELYHFCASILELVILVYKSRKAYGQLAKCHTLLTIIYESILDQESNQIPFIDATYYRVGFYGEKFGKLDRKEYCEPRDVLLGDIMEKLNHIYESRTDI
ncbi:unnamed protein product [Cochlearia groenlandica]